MSKNKIKHKLQQEWDSQHAPGWKALRMAALHFHSSEEINKIINDKSNDCSATKLQQLCEYLKKGHSTNTTEKHICAALSGRYDDLLQNYNQIYGEMKQAKDLQPDPELQMYNLLAPKLTAAFPDYQKNFQEISNTANSAMKFLKFVMLAEKIAAEKQNALDEKSKKMILAMTARYEKLAKTIHDIMLAEAA